jgi:hypothetical protein
MKNNNSLTLISDLISLIVRELRTQKRTWKINFWRKIAKKEVEIIKNN